MTKLFFILAVLSCTAFAFQCNSGEKTSNSKKEKSGYTNPFFPLTDGNSWKYVNSESGDFPGEFTVTVKDTKKVEEGTQMKMTSFPYLTKENTEQSIRQKPNGEIEAINYFSVTATFIPSADNFKKGYEWQYGVFRGYINGDNETVKTPRGTFEGCYYIMMTDGFTFSFEMWFKKDVGIVKWGSNRTNPPSIPSYYNLTEYTVN